MKYAVDQASDQLIDNNLSDGRGGFTYVSGQWDPGWTVAITDFNNDGQGDIMLSRADGTWVRATSGNNPGTFTYVAGNWGTGWTVYASG